ncbi:hypothetical protein SDC9_77949 [bioreactor metagenome]|uniref:Uncharacterized protein n=1 Tax=bioreactor metagenome TaxID=1076179 RepID=A0A644YZL6_9ZZZZ
MYFFGELGCFFGSVTQVQCGQHIALGCDTHTGTSSLSALLVYLLPKHVLGTFYFLAFGIIFYLLDDLFYLFKFQINNVIHDALRQLYVFLKQFEVEISIGFEWVHYV